MSKRNYMGLTLALVSIVLIAVANLRLDCFFWSSFKQYFPFVKYYNPTNKLNKVQINLSTIRIRNRLFSKLNVDLLQIHDLAKRLLYGAASLGTSK
jgi:hypothetical protein